MKKHDVYRQYPYLYPCRESDLTDCIHFVPDEKDKERGGTCSKGHVVPTQGCDDQRSCVIWGGMVGGRYVLQTTIVTGCKHVSVTTKESWSEE